MKRFSNQVTFNLIVLCLTVCVTQFTLHTLCQTTDSTDSLIVTTTTTQQTPALAKFKANSDEVVTSTSKDDIINAKFATDSELDKSSDDGKTTTQNNDNGASSPTTTTDKTGLITDNSAEDNNEEPEESDEPAEEETGNGIEKNDDEGSGEVEDGEEGEDGDFEERCTFNQFLSGLNISHYLPEDRGSLRDEYETFKEVPERIRYSPSVNYTMQRLKRLLNLANGITSRQELRSGFSSFIQANYEIFLELELDAPCMTSIISVIAAIRRSELWAIKCK